MTQQIPLNTLLGDRYKVTAQVLETASGDAVLDGLDQVLGRKISIVIAASHHARLLVTNARQTAALSRAAVQVLDLGNHNERTYLVTSHARPDTLLDLLLTEGGGGTEEFGEEIFGDTGTMTAPNTYVVAKGHKDAAAPAAAAAAASASEATSISATRPLDPVVEEPDDEFEEYDAEEEGYYEGDESASRNGGMWVVGIAAALLLMIGAGAVFTSLGGMVNSSTTEDALGNASVGAPERPTASASESPASSASPTQQNLPTPRFSGTLTRTVPSSPSLMAENDSMLGNLTDGNEGSTWISLAFKSPDFGGLADSIYFSGKLAEPTTVNSLTIDQVSGTGGAFTVYASDSESIQGAQEIGSGTFSASGSTTVELDQDAQNGETEYIIVQFTAAAQLSQPIVPNYIYGLRLAEISIK